MSLLGMLKIDMLKSLCFERARLQPRRKHPVYNVALATEGMLIQVSRPVAALNQRQSLRTGRWKHILCTGTAR